ncbi:MAG: hypothetical protein OXR64_01145 [Chloroflexota bacterium]|nr:hypothetical protein [Chloroflexota bacterium]MDE2918434.1 hypothetical protein [Chloroflexota bacterium]
MTAVTAQRPTLTPRAAWVLATASNAFELLRNEHGYTRCPEHRVDHTGKTARSIVINCALHAHTKQEKYLDRAVATARRVAARLAPDPAAGGAWVFFPGLHDPRNNSTNIIDAGECVDALASLLLHAGHELAAEERASFEQAIRLCCDTYLLTNVIDKPVVNQRLWGAMGLAAASAALDEPTWAQAVLDSVAGSLAEMRSDGSFAYVRDAALLGEGVGISDLTVYYHSRCVAFARHALRHIDAEASFEERLRDGADFLAFVLRPDGVMPLSLEGKRWFWDADDEVGSAPYGAYVLAADGRETLLPLAGRVAAQSAAALGNGGLIEATKGAPAFVCRYMHTADLAWLARAHAAAELDDLPSNPPAAARNAPAIAAEAGVARIESPRVCALVRTHKRPSDRLVGGRLGGGGLVYVGNARNGWRNHLRFRSEPEVPEGTWEIAPQSKRLVLPAWRQVLAVRESRFLLHIARTHARAGRGRYALMFLWRHFGPPSWRASRRWLSSHAVHGHVETANGSLVVESAVARADGRTLSGVRTRRWFQAEGTHLSVCDQLETSTQLSRVCYRLPVAAHDVDIEADGARRHGRDVIAFGALAAGMTARVKYRI